MSCFQAFTGLKVNVGNNKIVPIGEVSNIHNSANILHCRVGNLPMIYLGMPFGYLVLDSLYLESDSRKDGEEVGKLEAALFVKGWQTLLVEKYIVKPPDLLSFPFYCT